MLQKTTTYCLSLLMLAGCHSVGTLSPEAGAEEAVTSDGALTCRSLNVQRGGIGDGQSARALAVRDQSGTEDNWNRYVEFDPGSRVVCSFSVPDGASPTSAALRLNYRGPLKAEMRWVLEARDVQSGQWVEVGDNAPARDWVWTAWQTALPPPLGRFISRGSILIRYRAVGTYDASLLDELVIVLGGGSSSPDAGVAPPPPAPDAGVPSRTADGGTTPAPNPDAGAPTQPADAGAGSSDASAPDAACTPACNGKSCGSANGCGGTCQAGSGCTTGVQQPICAWNQAYEEYGQSDSVSAILSGARNCYVLVDPFDSSEVISGIPQMKANGNIVSCYISSGSCEDWRADYSSIRSFCGPAYPGWEGEYFVTDTAGILPFMKARIDKMAAWGCQMVEFDNMDWALDSGNLAGVNPSDATAYNQALCQYTRSKGMKCMAKSTTQGAGDFDGLTVESYTNDKNWWSTNEMKNMLAKGGIGLIVHYKDSNCDGVYSSYQTTYGSTLSFICSSSSGYLHYNQ